MMEAEAGCQQTASGCTEPQRRSQLGSQPRPRAPQERGWWKDRKPEERRKSYSLLHPRPHGQQAPTALTCFLGDSTLRGGFLGEQGAAPASGIKDS